MSNVCMIFNGAPDYRRPIYLLLDDYYDCDWYFIRPKEDPNSKEMDVSLLKRVHSLHEITLIKAPFTYQTGLIKLIFNKQYNIYLVAGSLWSFGIWFFCILKRIFFPHKRIFFWTHGILGKRSKLRNFIAKLFFKLPDGIFTYGDRAKRIMVGEGFDERKIWPIHNSLDYEIQVKYRDNFSDIYSSHFGNPYPVIFFIGRLTPVKKLDLLVKAFNVIQIKGVEANLTFIGDGPMKEELQFMVNEMGLKDKVWFYGKCYDEKEKSKLIVNADLCVAPGNIGLTAMDSLVYGTPCITMDNFDMQMPEHEAIKEGVTGCFFKENDVDDLAAKIINWLHNYQDRDMIRQNCYKEIDQRWNPIYQLGIIKEHFV